jgi:uncharacterized protein (TIGR02246 family)
VDAATAARAWAEGWSRAWRAKDPAAVAALYAEDVFFSGHPFREPLRGRAAVQAWATAVFASEEGTAEPWFGEAVVAGDRAAVEYWAVIRHGGRASTLAGVTLLRFGEDGLAVEHREFWLEVDQERARPTPS